MSELPATHDEDAGPGDFGSLSPELFDRLSPFLLESVAVVSAEGRVQALLGPPGGALGITDVVGRHIFEYCLEEDVPRAVELAVEALNSSPGWSTTWITRLVKASGESAEFEIHIENHQDDPVVDGFILRLRELPTAGPVDAPIFATELGAELERLAGAVPLPILFIGSNGNLYFQNEAGRAFCRELAADLRAVGFSAIATERDRPVLDAAVQELLVSPGERTVTFQMAGSEATPRMTEARLSGLGHAGRVLALVATLVDVTDRLAIESELRRRAASDPLTGLINRNELDEVLAVRLRRRADHVTLLYVDLDGFKSVNDTRGHSAGDEFLVAVAGILTANVRSGDVVARIGGDEFVVALDQPAAGAAALVVRVERQIVDHAAALGLAVSASIGIVTGATGDTALDLLRRADRAMYEVKRTRKAPD